MPTRLSSYYNDPNIGQGFESLAKAFAPPEATDVLASEKAKATREQASRLAALFEASRNPGVSRDELDRLGIGSGAFNPNQSYYSVDQSNQTARSNSALDNARALQQTRLQQAGETDRAMLSPVSQDQVRFVPSGIAKLYGVPEQQYGSASLQPGETVVRPDGSRLEGAAKPLTSDELKAKIVGGLPAREQRAFGLGGIPTVNVTGQDGRPVVAFGPDAVGQQPAPAAVAPSNVSRLQAERAALPAGDPRIAELSSAIEAEGRGAVADPFRTKADTQAADRYGTLAEAGQQARTAASDIDLLGELLTDAPTGATAETRLKVANYAKELGLNDVANGLTGGKMDNLTAANAIAQRIAPTLRVPGSGAQSDRELTNFLASLPSISTQPGGNRLILDTLRGGAVYKQQVGEIAAKALRGEISRAEADAQIAATPTPFSAFSAARSAPAPAASAGATAQPVRVSTPEEARRLPRGTPIQLPDGSIGKVP